MARRTPVTLAALAFAKGLASVAALACAVAFAFAAPAGASPVLLYDGGHVTTVDDPALPPAADTNPVSLDAHECAPAATSPAATPAQTPAPTAQTAAISVRRALRRAYDRGELSRATYSSYGDVYSQAKSAWHRLAGNRRAELGAVIASVNSFAARGILTASRMEPVFLELQRNTQWWSRTSATPAPSGDDHVPHKKTACTTAGRIAAGPRVQFKGDPLTFQYYPGSGLRLQPLANFGAANALYNACKGIDTEPGTPCEADKLRDLLDRLTATAVKRDGFLAWEYYFPFSGGRPPWVSGIATGSALSALSRSSVLFKEQEQAQQAPQPGPAQPTGGSTPTAAPAPSAPAPGQHDSAYYLSVAKQALPVYAHSAPTGIRAPASHGNHYLIYSFDSGLRVGNAFLESLIGLWDYWQASGDRTAHSLFVRGDREARHELPLLDTGAWSLYSLGGAEADLNYQRVIRDFAQGLCDRTHEGAYCSKAKAWDADLHRPSRVKILGPRSARIHRPVRISIRVDKISCLTIQILRGSTVVYQPTWYFPRGVHSFSWTPPHSGSYRVHVLARDLLSRQSRADSTLRVVSR